MSKTIDEMTEEELLQAIENKKQKKRYDTMPKATANPDFSNVIEMIQADMNDLAYDLDNYREHKDFEQHVYEKVCLAIYGTEYFTWRRIVFKNY